MLRSALAVAAFVAAAPAFAGSVPVVSAPATVNPPVSTPAPASSAVSMPAMSDPAFLSTLISANVRLVGAIGGATLPPGSFSVRPQGLTPSSSEVLRALEAQLRSQRVDFIRSIAN